MPEMLGRMKKGQIAPIPLRKRDPETEVLGKWEQKGAGHVVDRGLGQDPGNHVVVEGSRSWCNGTGRAKMQNLLRS